MALNIQKQASYYNTTAYYSRPLSYIVIHYTAGVTSRTGSARNTAMYFSNPGVYASADFIVDDTTAVQFNPDIKNYYCWHCGDNKTYNKGGAYYGSCQNYNSIGIEVCSTNNTGTMTYPNDGKYYFTDAVVQKTIELTKYLMKTYNIDADHVIRHYDVTGKLCPGIVGWNEDSGNAEKWKAFKAALRTASAQTPSSSQAKNTDSTQLLYRIRKTATDSKTQKGAYKNLQSAKDVADRNAEFGYKVFDSNNKLIYTPKVQTNSTAKAYQVIITADVLNVRNGAGADYKINTTVKKGEVYTIVAENNGWGKLKSNAGWISLKYTKKK